MPIVKPAGAEDADAEGGADKRQLSALERQELERCEKVLALEEQLARLQRERTASIQQELGRVLQIDNQGRLFFHYAQQPQTVAEPLTVEGRGPGSTSKGQAAGKELYLPILYSPTPQGSATAPSQGRRKNSSAGSRACRTPMIFPSCRAEGSMFAAYELGIPDVGLFLVKLLAIIGGVAVGAYGVPWFGGWSCGSSPGRSCRRASPAPFASSADSRLAC